MARPADLNVYAEIRKSTLEPDNSSGRQNAAAAAAATAAATLSNGGVARRAAGNLQLDAVNAEGRHDSLQDLTLVENFLYKNSAECSKPALGSDNPGT